MTATPWMIWISCIGAEVVQQRAEHQRAHHHAEQQHHIEQRHHARARLVRGEVIGQREARRLRRVDARADQQEGQRRADLAPHGGAMAVAGQHQQREGQDGEAAELHHGAEPDVGHAPPAQHRRCVSDLKPISARNGAKTMGSDTIRPDEPGGNAQFDDHHAVQRAGQQHHGHADRDLEQRQPQQAAQGQIRGRGIGEGQEAGTQSPASP